MSDEIYRGHRLAFWLLLAVVLLKSAIALGTIFNGQQAAQSADGIPLDRFGADGAQAVVALFAMWGVGQLALNAFGVLALTRRRALIPFVFGVLLLEHLARKAVLLLHPIVKAPIAKAGAPPGAYINAAILGLTVLGLGLSVWRPTQPVHE